MLKNDFLLPGQIKRKWPIVNISPTPIDHSLFTIHLIIHHTLSITHYQLSIIHYFIIHYSS